MTTYRRRTAILAAVSLYTACSITAGDRGAEIVAKLANRAKAAHGLCIIVMASRASYLYTIKRKVLSDLQLIDRSTYGEDIENVLPRDGKGKLKLFFDSLVNVTTILRQADDFQKWLSYFCKVGESELRERFDEYHKLRPRHSDLGQGHFQAMSKSAWRATVSWQR